MSVTGGGLGETIQALVQAQLERGAALTLTVTTTSMLPTLLPGERIIVRDVASDELRIGDLVLVQSGAEWLAHRLIDVRVSEKVFCTKGDNGVLIDRFWTADQVRGIIVSSQSGNHRLNWRSGWVVRANRFLAWLSRGQASAFQAPPSLARRLALRGWHTSLYLSAWIVRALAK